ncbi:MAG: oligosaccharide flippase family protein [Pirellulales bacterium]|nr:oligosaccharide flippase family protein [Pirellulales bacterium]
MAAALVLPGMLAAFLDLGLPISNVYYLNRSRDAGVLFLNGAIFLTVVSLVSVCLSGAAMLWGVQIKYFAAIHSAGVVLAALATTYLLLLRAFLQQFLRGLHCYHVPIASQIYHDVFRLGAILTLFCFLEITVDALVLIAFSALLLVDVYLLRFVALKIRIRKAHPSFSQFRENMSYGLRHFLGTSLEALNTRIDLLVLALFLDQRTLGIYALAAGLGEIVHFVPWAVGYVLQPKLTREDDPFRRQAIVRRCLGVTSAVLVTSWVSFAVVGSWLVVWVCGTQYRDSYLPAVFLMGGHVWLGLATVMNKYFTATGRPEICSLTRALNLPIKAAALYFLCRYFGVTGAALSFGISSLALLLITCAVYRRIVSVDLLKSGHY